MSSETLDKEKEKLIQENLLLLKYKVQEQRLEEIWDKFTDAGFKPILIKGWAAALKYPNPAERLYVDVDLIFDPSEYEKALEFIPGNSFNLDIDLHCGARHLDSLDFSRLYQNSTLHPCGKTQIRILSEEDHLRILCVHWLTDGGTSKERLWDIYHAVDRRYDGFDWEKCLDTVDKKRRRWVVTAIGLANHYLNLPADDLPFRDEFQKIPRWIYKALEKEWASGLRLMPLHYYLHDKKQLWKQIKKRIPPNPITATILVNGAFNNTPRIFYQIANTIQRTIPSWRRIRQRLD